MNLFEHWDSRESFCAFRDKSLVAFKMKIPTTFFLINANANLEGTFNALNINSKRANKLALRNFKQNLQKSIPCRGAYHKISQILGKLF